MHFKIVRLTTIRNGPKQTISTSDGFRHLQVISEPIISVLTRGVGPQERWTVRSHIGRLEGVTKHILYLSLCLCFASYFYSLHYTVTRRLLNPTNQGEHSFLVLELCLPCYSLFCDITSPNLRKSWASEVLIDGQFSTCGVFSFAYSSL